MKEGYLSPSTHSVPRAQENPLASRFRTRRLNMSDVDAFLAVLVSAGIKTDVV